MFHMYLVIKASTCLRGIVISKQCKVLSSIEGCQPSLEPILKPHKITCMVHYISFHTQRQAHTCRHTLSNNNKGSNINTFKNRKRSTHFRDCSLVGD